MRSTTVPTTLAEYQEYVRKEALKIQLDMGWPDEKLNATLKALGLPEKLTFRVPVEVTGRTFALIKVDDTASEEEARAKIAAMTGDDLRAAVRNSGIQMGNFATDDMTVIEALPTTFEVGDPDTTYANGSFARAYDHSSTYCETYSPDGARYYCTRQRGHDGDHAQGNGSTIVGTWAA